jgi:HD-GYP domain-containing protein (c-di-GMP phosphodiesterase class II)
MNASGSWFAHTDALAPLGRDLPFSEKLAFLHDYLRNKVAEIHRVAVVLYDPVTDILKTFAHSSLGDNPLSLYESRLSDSQTLQEIVKRRAPRVINDLAALLPPVRPPSDTRAENEAEKNGDTPKHLQKIKKQGYASSYTLPIFKNDNFIGFLFFNSYRKNVFTEQSLSHFDLVGHLIAYALLDQISTARSLVASVRGASTLAQHRDYETGAHLDRMAHYARLIALQIAPKYGLTDSMIEHIFLFAPLHDIGKIGIPDGILLKPGKLTEDEFAMMKEHPEKGADIIDALLSHFGLQSLEHAPLLRNIALYHHETLNGKGYPHGLKGDQIPIESRIAAVADIFDALTSVRPYKKAWSNEEAFALLQRLAGDALDEDCVAALLACEEEVKAVQARFVEDEHG